MNMEFKKSDDLINRVWGEEGTPERDAMEQRVKEDVSSFMVGEAVKKARLQQNLTQEDLGERIGVKKTQISKLESGRCSPTLATISRVFRALGMNAAALDLGAGGKIQLW